jgi:hypothetical protein
MRITHLGFDGVVHFGKNSATPPPTGPVPRSRSLGLARARRGAVTRGDGAARETVGGGARGGGAAFKSHVCVARRGTN